MLNSAIYLASSGSKITNPFLDKSSDPFSFIRWLLKGVDVEDPKPIENAEGFETYIKRIMEKTGGADVKTISKNWEGIYTQVKDMVDLEFANKITTDPLRLLTAATQESQGNHSPRTVLVMTKAFIDEMALGLPAGSDSDLQALLSETSAMIKTSVKLIDDEVKWEEEKDIPTGSKSKVGEKLTALQRVQKLVDTLRLIQGIQFFNDRIRDFVNQGPHGSDGKPGIPQGR